MPKFTKRLVTIEAVQFFKEGDHPLVRVGNPDAHGQSKDRKQGFFIKTLEGWLRVTPGDWIIKGVKGDHYPCKPDIFEQTYVKTEE